VLAFELVNLTLVHVSSSTEATGFRQLSISAWLTNFVPPYCIHLSSIELL
jgi:hypothetical protein